MWFTYCGASSDRVALDTFVMAVSTYLEEQLGMPLDAVEGVLTPECREALTLALDMDGNGEVNGEPAVRKRDTTVVGHADTKLECQS